MPAQIDLEKLLKDGSPRPKLALILHAKAKIGIQPLIGLNALNDKKFVEHLLSRYWRFGEDTYISEIETAHLRRMAQ